MEAQPLEEEAQSEAVVAVAKISAMENVHLPRAVARALDVNTGDDLAFVRIGNDIFIRKATIKVEY